MPESKTVMRRLAIQKPTNADRIRAMSDEELAEWLIRIKPFVVNILYQYTKDKWLDWLKQEAEE